MHDMTEPFVETQESNLRPRPPVWMIVISFAVLLIFLAFIGWGMLRTQQGPILVGQQAPDFSLTSFDGQEFSKASLAGKVVVINFWASWCLPCEDEAALLETSWQYFQSHEDVVFLGVDYADTPKESEEFLQTNQITYPNGIDMGTHMAKAYRIRGVPETFIIGRDGRIAAIKIGPINSADELIALLELQSSMSIDPNE
jgi:cytochrome c biogenesis protein CcmG/thiol:disulfide interchange protein DsbE